MSKSMQKRKRQHPLWILYEIGLSLKEVIFPIIIVFVFNFRNEALWVQLGSIALILYIVYRMIAIIFQWKNNTYLFTDKNIEVFEGRFVARKRYVALNRIQSYQQHTSFFHRLFRLTSISIITGTSSDNASIKLQMISHKEAENIMERLQAMKEDTASVTVTSESPQMEKRTVHYRMSFQEIIIISLSSLYFLAIFPILLSIYFKVDELFSLETFAMKVFDFLAQSWLMIAIVSIIVLFIAVCSGIIITYLRFGNYEVSSDQHLIYISKGVLHKTNYTIPRDKINGLRIEKNFPRRLFNICKIQIISLGDLFDGSEMETDTLFPFISEERLTQLLPEIIPEFAIQEEMKSLPKEALFVNLIQPSYTLVIVTFLVFFFWPEYWFIPLALFILIVFVRILKTHQTKYVKTDKFLQFQSGALSTELFITRRDKIDELEIDQSWIEQKLGLASISSTSRAKPIYVSRIEHIHEEAAYEYYHWFKEEAKHVK